MLIKEDGLDEGWLDRSESDFDEDDFWAVTTGRMLRNQSARAEDSIVAAFRTLDLTGRGPGPGVAKRDVLYAGINAPREEDVDLDSPGPGQAGPPGSQHYNQKNDTEVHFQRRSCLIDHYNIMFKSKEIVWPSRHPKR